MGEELSCSFCGRMKTQTEVLIAGLDAHISDQCVEQASVIIINESKNDKGINLVNILGIFSIEYPRYTDKACPSSTTKSKKFTA